ncbi:MAG: membrane dipeptidase [Acidobacteria bacterium]|nr:membrane dipeptidase [Acidobacteriota bacterium]
MNRRSFLNASLTASLAQAAGSLDPGSNEKIRRGREAALAVLKPKPKDLEHGLELHANSIVIEPYGFSPTSAPDGNAIRAAMEAGASMAEIDDMIEDMRFTRHVSDAEERAEFTAAWKAAGVTCIFQNAGGHEHNNDPGRVIKRLGRFTYANDMLSGIIRRTVDPDDIPVAKAQDKHCVFYMLSGVPMPQTRNSVEEEVGYIQVFYHLGVRMMALTYNRRNLIGDGCAEPGNAGLSDAGRAVVAEMNRLGVIVDVGHAGWRTSLEAARISKGPIVSSHTACAGLHRHFRGTPDEVIRAIVDNGGLIGICAIPRFLGRTEDINAMLDHIDYAAKRFGVDHVGIATDLAYRSRKEATANMPKRPPARARWENFWPKETSAADRPLTSPTMTWTNWPLFTVGLVQRGYSDDDIRKIIGGNTLRVARAVLPRKVAA